MNVLSIFQNAIPNSSFYTRRGPRIGQRENQGFHRLVSSDSPESHFQRDTQRISPTRSTHRQENVVPNHQRPIELTNFQSQAVSRSTHQSGGEREPFAQEFQLVAEPQIYNETSEDLPQNEQEGGLTFTTFSQVRSKFPGTISGNDDAVGDVVVPRIYSGERGACCKNSFCCPCPCGKGVTICILTLSTIIISILSITILLLYFDKDNDNPVKVFSDYEILTGHEWPLQDIESINVSYKSIERKHEQWNFELEDEDGPEHQKDERREGSYMIGDPSEAKSKKHYPGLFTLRGHFIDETVAENIFQSAKEILSANLHENSTRLEMLVWKGEAIKFALQELNKSLNISLDGDSLEGLFEDSLCDKEVDLPCNKTSWFRSINGSCNNAIHTSWGSRYSPFRRIIKPANFKEQLPLLTKSITEQLTGGTPVVDPEVSAILPLWSMFILHDTLKIADSPVPCLDHTDENTTSSGSSLQNKIKMKKGCVISDSVQTDKCSALVTCPAQYPACKIGPQTSFNLVTSFIDASNIYGSSEDRTEKLRLKKMGRMKILIANHTQGLGFLPLAANQNETCVDGSGPNCFISGDDDVNQLSALTALNTLFVRQHNRLASWLQHLNAHWDDERLFQESRRILIAQIQHITYNEFLPPILGNHWLNLSGLSPEKTGFYELYNPEIDPSVSDAYAGAAGYFWYSMAVDRVQSIWKKGKHSSKVRHDFSLQVLSPEFLLKGKSHLEAILRGFASLPVNRVGIEFPSEFRSLHIHSLNLTVDLVKSVLQIGRSLEIAPYMEWRKACGFREIKSFQAIKDHWLDKAYSSITSVYKKLEDVDLLVGLLAEKPIPSGRVGPTLACLLTDQFLRFKKGDRFWYEGNLYFHHFTPSQLESIRETTLARILCDNTDRYFDQVQKWPMLLTSPQSNPVLDCSDFDGIPNIMIHLWKENPATGNKSEGDTDENDYDDNDTDFYNDVDPMNYAEKDNQTTSNSTESTTTMRPTSIPKTGNGSILVGIGTGGVHL